MHTHNPSPTARPYRHPFADDAGGRDNDDLTELTIEEEAALAHRHRHISETSYLPAPVDYLHVR